ncbi:MAG: response regulator [Ruminiclostridium sp.]|nr:response regulator [Ruminiclostridium sp.]
MGILLSAALIIMGTVSTVYGVQFFRREKSAGYFRAAILLMGLAVGIWGFGYGFIGICGDFAVCSHLRRAGLFGVNTFPLAETIVALHKAGVNRKIQNIVRFILIPLALTDWWLFSGEKVDEFVRVGNWTTWQAVDCPERTFHSIYTVVIFLSALTSWIVWFGRVKLKREKALLIRILAANLTLMLCSGPDTFLTDITGVVYPTSGLGAGLAFLIWIIAVVKYNTFTVSSRAMGDYAQTVVNVGLVIFNDSFLAMEMNNFARKELDMAPGRHLTELVRLQQSEEEIFGCVNESGSYKFKCNSADGDKTCIADIITLRDNYGEAYGYILTVTDISKEEQLIAEARQANEAKSDFLTNMSHEIRTPINAVLGFDELILRETKEEATNVYAANIKHSGETLLSLVNDILDFSKIESGKMEIVPVNYDPAQMFEDLIVMITPRAEAKELAIEYDIAGDIPAQLFGDDLRIRQAVTNLLTNAVKYTETGTVTLSAWIKERRAGTVILHISVKDTGIGIKDDDKAHLFDSFRRVDISRNRNIEGTGLGLSITLRCLELMGSSLMFDSEYGKGSDFWFDIEQKTGSSSTIGSFAERMSLARRSVSVSRESFTAPGAKVLVTDDNQMNLQVFRGLLKKTEADITSVTSGADTIAAMEKQKYDIVFLDHMMPEMDGIETLEKIKASRIIDTQGTPIIALTANAVSGAREMYLNAGFDDYLTKPIRYDKLEKMILKYLPDEKIMYNKAEGTAASQAAHDSPEPENTLNEEINDLIDKKVGLEYCMNDENFYREMLDTYIKEKPEKLAQLGSALENGDIKRYTVLIHGLKSTSKMIGSVKFSELAYELERAGKEGRLDDIRKKHNYVMKVYGWVIKEAQKMI